MTLKNTLVRSFGLAMALGLTLPLVGLRAEQELERSSVAMVDLGASRRALRALMHDWQDDETVNAPRRRAQCLNAMMSAEGSPLIFPANDLLWRLPDFLMNRQNGRVCTPPVPLRERLRSLAMRPELTVDERRTVELLETRTVEDSLDRIRWVVDLQGELMKISDRLYSARWKELLRQARENPTFLTGADDPVKVCLAAQVRSERNRQLTRGAERILALFDFLELEQDREFGGGGSVRP
jgi:hypothetical protein